MMKYMEKRLSHILARGAFLVAAALAMPSPSTAGTQTDKVRVGAYASISDAGLYIAKDKGYFAEQGISVEIVQVNTGSEMTSQLANGGLRVPEGLRPPPLPPFAGELRTIRARFT